MIFNAWKEYVVRLKSDDPSVIKKQGVISADSMESSLEQGSSISVPIPDLSGPNFSTDSHVSTSSTSVPPQISRRAGLIKVGQTRGTLLTATSTSSKDYFVLERIGWYSGPVFRSLMDLVESGSIGTLDVTPTQSEFELCCHAIWSRHTTPPPPTETATLEETPPAETLQNSLYGMNTTKALEAILDGAVITPELIEQTSVHIGDKYIPLVAVLLSKCIPYVAKRVILNDCKEMVMRCNNPLTALMIGHHITRLDFPSYSTNIL